MEILRCNLCHDRNILSNHVNYFISQPVLSKTNLFSIWYCPSCYFTLDHFPATERMHGSDAVAALTGSTRAHDEAFNCRVARRHGSQVSGTIQIYNDNP